jgi:hypothetical protein
MGKTLGSLVLIAALLVSLLHAQPSEILPTKFEPSVDRGVTAVRAATAQFMT